MSSIEPPHAPRRLLAAGGCATTRRVALRGGAAALTTLAASACDRSDDSGEDGPAGPAGEGAEGATTAGDDDAVDAGLARDALALIDAALALVAAVTAQHPAAVGTLADALVATHGTHRDLLVEAVADAPSPAPVTSAADPGRAWLSVRRREQALQTELATLAVRARSGPFARLLATMAASVAQHLAVLPAVLPAAGPAAGRTG